MSSSTSNRRDLEQGAHTPTGPNTQTFRNLSWRAPRPAGVDTGSTLQVNGLPTPTEPNRNSVPASYNNSNTGKTPVAKMSAMDVDESSDRRPPPINTSTTPQRPEIVSAPADSRPVRARDSPATASPGDQPVSATTGAPKPAVGSKAWLQQISDEKDTTLLSLMIIHQTRNDMVAKRDRMKADMTRFGTFFEPGATDMTSKEIRQADEAIKFIDEQLAQQAQLRDQLSAQLTDVIYQKSLDGREVKLTPMPAPPPPPPPQKETSRTSNADTSELRHTIERVDEALKKLDSRVARHRKEFREDIEDLNKDLSDAHKRIDRAEDGIDQLFDETKDARKSSKSVSRAGSEDVKESKEVKELKELKKRLESVERDLDASSKKQDDNLRKAMETESAKQQAMDKSLAEIQIRLQNTDLVDKSTVDKMKESWQKQMQEIGSRLEPLAKQMSDLREAVQASVKDAATSYPSANATSDPVKTFKKKGFSPEAFEALMGRMRAHDDWLANISRRIDATTGRDQAMRLLEVMKEQIPDLSSLLRSLDVLNTMAAAAKSNADQMRSRLDAQESKLNEQGTKLAEQTSLIYETKGKLHSALSDMSNSTSPQAEKLLALLREQENKVTELQAGQAQGKKERDATKEALDRLEDFMVESIGKLNGDVQAIENAIPVDKVKALIAFTEEERGKPLATRQSDADMSISEDDEPAQQETRVRVSPRKQKATNSGNLMETINMGNSLLSRPSRKRPRTDSGEP